MNDYSLKHINVLEQAGIDKSFLTNRTLFASAESFILSSLPEQRVLIFNRLADLPSHHAINLLEDGHLIMSENYRWVLPYVLSESDNLYYEAVESKLDLF